MPNVTFAGVTYACDVAIKGYNYIELQDANGLPICRFDDITDFSAFRNDGAWTDPTPVPSTTATKAVLTGGNIVLTIRPDHFVGTGTMVKFSAPCACNQVTGGIVIAGVTYAVVDAVGENALGTGGAWCEGAQVAILLDCVNTRAFLQGGAPARHIHAASDITSGTFAGAVAANSNGQAYGSYLVRNSKLSAVEETPTINGQICWLYE